jgi:5'-nucleotidase
VRILISNDDGIYAEGINALRERLEKVEDIKKIFIVAPDRERSAIGHGITMHKPLRIKEIKYSSDKSFGWAVNGTPADCVKLALEELVDLPVDIVISGINRGANLGTDVIYSGTVSAAVEAVINGYQAIAVSNTSFSDTDYSVAADFIAKIIPQVFLNKLPKGSLLNINVPPGNSRGVKVVRLGNTRYVNIFDRRTDPRGNVYFWMAGEVFIDKNEARDTDIVMTSEGYITVTPVQVDITNNTEIERIKGWQL